MKSYIGEHPFDDKCLHQIYSFMKISIAFHCGVLRKNYNYYVRKAIAILMRCKEWAVIQILLKYRSELFSLWKSIILSLEALRKYRLYISIQILFRNECINFGLLQWSCYNERVKFWFGEGKNVMHPFVGYIL